MDELLTQKSTVIGEITEAIPDTTEGNDSTHEVLPEPIEPIEIEESLEKIPEKKPRSPAQVLAFQKAQAALKVKRELRKKELAMKPKPKRGRPIKIKAPAGTIAVREDTEDESESETDEQVYITTRRKSSRASKKPKMKPKRRIVYVSESESESESESDSDSEQYLQYPPSAPPPLSPFDGLRFL